MEMTLRTGMVRSSDRDADEARVAVEVRSISRRSARRRRSGTHPCGFATEPCMRSLVPTAPGRPRCSGTWRASVDPDAGTVVIKAIPLSSGPPRVSDVGGHDSVRGSIFYLRISGTENLIFFARLYGLDHSQAKSARASASSPSVWRRRATAELGVLPTACQKRLSVARALLVPRPILPSTRRRTI